MVVRLFKYRNVCAKVAQPFAQLPRVTVQVPVYNERNVVGRIIDSVALLDYPENLLQIQIVDDSNDETYDLIRTKVTDLKARGLNIEHVHRVDRQGFKAGALRDAMSSASGEFIAIFDADFMPPADFLLNTINHFSNDKLAMVQTRWSHLNVGSNRLTRTQAMMLDSHFAIEQQVRYASKMLFNFNGTAGVWRVDAIIDAGHWSADTLTEDLDLSYRAQLRGWEMLYLNDIHCPAELPSDMRAFKSQQHRWAKGGIQVMKKLLGTVWRSDYRFTKKVESTFHLSNNFAYFIMLLDTLFFLIPSLLIREQLDVPMLFWFDIPLLLLSSGSHLVYLYFGQIALDKSRWHALLNLPWLLLLGICLAFNNARAALEALANKESEFVRTPKSGELKAQYDTHVQEDTQTQEDTVNIAIRSFKKYNIVLPASEGVEVVASFVFMFAAAWAIHSSSWHMVPFLVLLALGFSGSAIVSIRARFAV